MKTIRSCVAECQSRTTSSAWRARSTAPITFISNRSTCSTSCTIPLRLACLSVSARGLVRCSTVTDTCHQRSWSICTADKATTFCGVTRVPVRAKPSTRRWCSTVSAAAALIACPCSTNQCGAETGGLLRLGARLMQSFSACSADLIPLVNTFSLYYQIRDDYINLQSNAYMQNKSFCEDLTEGKFSYPIIHSIRATPHDHRLLSKLRCLTRVNSCHVLTPCQIFSSARRTTRTRSAMPCR